MLVLVLTSSCATENAIGIMILLPVASHDQKKHVTPHFGHLGIRNTMMPLMTPSALIDGNTFFQHVPCFFYMCLFHDCLNDSASSSATPNCFSKFLPRAIHNWIGMVVGFLSGQILSWVTHIFIMSLYHAWASM